MSMCLYCSRTFEECEVVGHKLMFDQVHGLWWMHCSYFLPSDFCKFRFELPEELQDFELPEELQDKE